MAKNKKTKKDIDYGNVSIPDESFKDENIRVSISLRIRGDVLLALRKRAEEEGIGYQTLINQALYKFVQKPSTNSRLIKLETAVFKKARGA